MSAFAELLALVTERDADGPLCTLDPGDTVMGRPGVMHGGGVAALMEQAARAVLVEALGNGGGPLPTITLATMTVDYLRAGPMQPVRARGRVVRVGGRAASIAAEAWAEDAAKPFGAARFTFLIGR